MDEVYAGPEGEDQEVHEQDVEPTPEEIFAALKKMTPGQRLEYEMMVKKYFKQMRKHRK